MNLQRSFRLSLAGAIALAFCGMAAFAAAQTLSPRTSRQVPPTPPPRATPQNSPQPSTIGQFYQGTESSATYPLPDSHGGTLTVHAGMPEHVRDYGPPPSFKSLDANHDGRISESEAQAYPPLDSDFLYASGGGKSISHAQYQRWVSTQH
jgi:hypothetical protein